MILGKLISEKLYKAESVDQILSELCPDYQVQRARLRKIYVTYIEPKLESKLERMKSRPLS